MSSPPKSSTPPSSNNTNQGSAHQSGPPRIIALPKQVVDRIAAGEVVQRPSSVIKELIENSLDADATSIDVQVAGGGLHYLVVTDDGIGIHPGDLALAATRFATSKIREWDDLKSIETFGFRGEALASTSMVGKLSITSRRRRRKITDSTNENLDSGFSGSCAYKQAYIEGLPTTPKPLPSAGKEGTSIKVEDLFYNIPSRRRGKLLH